VGKGATVRPAHNCTQTGHGFRSAKRLHDGMLQIACYRYIGFGHFTVQLMTTPPLTWMIWPEMNELSALARKTKQVATSTGWPARSIGTDVPNFSIESSVIVAGMSGVQIGPGATANDT
jgi:hypothetical protein